MEHLEQNSDIKQVKFTPEDVDKALGRLPSLGKWRLINYSLICLAFNIPGAWHMLSIVFLGGEPESVLCDGQVIEQKTCKAPDWECTAGFEYPNSSMGPTIVTDFDLVCKRDYLSETSQMVFNVGVMLGALVIPSLSDRFGRRPMHLICQALDLIFGIGLAFSNSIITFIILRGILGATREGLGLSGIVLACELFPAQHRAVAGTALQFFWSLSWALLALMAYLIRDWHYLQLGLSLSGVLTFSFVWFVPESVPWLVAKNKIQEAEAILQKAKRTDGVRGKFVFFMETNSEKLASTEKLDNQVQDSELLKLKAASDNENKRQELTNQVHEEHTNDQNDLKQYYIFDICKSCRLFLYSVLMCLLWFINVVVYYGLSLSTFYMPGDAYLLFFINGTVEVPAYILTVILLKYFGRRWPLAAFHAVAGLGLLGSLLGKTQQNGVMEVAFSMLGKFGITASFAVIVLYANEIYPTTLRNTGFGLASTSGRIGGVLAPLFVYIAKHKSSVPMIVFAVLALIAIPVGIAIPETSGKALPQTIEDVEGWTNGFNDVYKKIKSKYQQKSRKREEENVDDDSMIYIDAE